MPHGNSTACDFNGGMTSCKSSTVNAMTGNLECWESWILVSCPGKIVRYPPPKSKCGRLRICIVLPVRKCPPIIKSKDSLSRVFLSGREDLHRPPCGETSAYKSKGLSCESLFVCRGERICIVLPVRKRPPINQRDSLARVSLSVGARGFEPPTSCTPCKRASRAAPRPDGWFGTSLSLLQGNIIVLFEYSCN